MNTGKVITWGLAIGAGLVIMDRLWPGGLIPRGSRLYWLLHPEERKLREQLTQMEKEKQAYWEAYIDSVTTGVDRVEALRSALDPYIPSFAPLEYPFLELSFGQLAAPGFPGLPSPAEWNALLQAKLREAIQHDAAQISEPWTQWESWPTPGG